MPVSCGDWSLQQHFRYCECFPRLSRATRFGRLYTSEEVPRKIKFIKRQTAPVMKRNSVSLVTHAENLMLKVESKVGPPYVPYCSVPTKLSRAGCHTSPCFTRRTSTQAPPWKELSQKSVAAATRKKTRCWRRRDMALKIPHGREQSFGCIRWLRLERKCRRGSRWSSLPDTCAQSVLTKS
jgi:hypothetical protein